MSKGKSLPHIPPNCKLIVRHKANGDTEYIIRPVEDDDEYLSGVWGVIVFVALMIGVFVMFGKH
jgi:hypothetical protein